ncbi:oxygen-dependent coproporphyrinogen oxidase [Marivirga arenosa]|uniref:coproporphyrinogen oxidase n=1 Tax=Marivirga arenosa TaxID=3059076 RepID=A0AA52EXQ8_9BACT|nr:oxygen-dependent coproporphyrinogen oxidase [Marivirga sp. BKB1-2]WNB17482.1 oxygen-dependent coproporphyrinogen oxidase [Marivirga sp. BKB1-2]
MNTDKISISNWFKGLQSNICNVISETDGKGQFEIDEWDHAKGGGGKSRLLQNGNILEKAGVNFSAVEGPAPEGLLKTLEIKDDGSNELNFFATGVSIVMHPFSPMVPIIHMNVRYFELSNGTYWFGGGIDLTPHIINKAQAQFFHQELKKVCDKHDVKYYPKFKKWADDYFYLPHRKETRGIGGIFFDRLSEDENHSKEDIFAFVQSVGELFAPVYSHLMKLNQNESFEEEHKKWQLLRRGRYVEFNLVWDRGTKFGLQTNGRTESILMSMPPQANWAYDYTPEKDFEKETVSLLKKEIDWVNNN